MNDVRKRTGNKRAVIRDVFCCLCPVPGGALKRTTGGGWVHVLCALWCPGVWIADLGSMSPIEVNVDAAAAARSRRLTNSRDLDTLLERGEGHHAMLARVTMPAPQHAAILRQHAQQQQQQGGRAAGLDGDLALTAVVAVADTAVAAVPPSEREPQQRRQEQSVSSHQSDLDPFPSSSASSVPPIPLACGVCDSARGRTVRCCGPLASDSTHAGMAFRRLEQCDAAFHPLCAWYAGHYMRVTVPGSAADVVAWGGGRASAVAAPAGEHAFAFSPAAAAASTTTSTTTAASTAAAASLMYAGGGEGLRFRLFCGAHGAAAAAAAASTSLSSPRAGPLGDPRGSPSASLLPHQPQPPLGHRSPELQSALRCRYRTLPRPDLTKGAPTAPAVTATARAPLAPPVREVEVVAGGGGPPRKLKLRLGGMEGAPSHPHAGETHEERKKRKKLKKARKLAAAAAAAASALTAPPLPPSLTGLRPHMVMPLRTPTVTDAYPADTCGACLHSLAAPSSGAQSSLSAVGSSSSSAPSSTAFAPTEEEEGAASTSTLRCVELVVVCSSCGVAVHARCLGVAAAGRLARLTSPRPGMQQSTQRPSVLTKTPYEPTERPSVLTNTPYEPTGAATAAAANDGAMAVLDGEHEAESSAAAARTDAAALPDGSLMSCDTAAAAAAAAAAMYSEHTRGATAVTAPLPAPPPSSPSSVPRGMVSVLPSPYTCDPCVAIAELSAAAARIAASPHRHSRSLKGEALLLALSRGDADDGSGAAAAAAGLGFHAQCALCCRLGGVLRRTHPPLGWVHLFCARAVPGVVFWRGDAPDITGVDRALFLGPAASSASGASPASLSTVGGISSASALSSGGVVSAPPFTHRCELCDTIGGALVQCAAPQCASLYHPLCAARAHSYYVSCEPPSEGEESSSGSASSSISSSGSVPFCPSHGPSTAVFDASHGIWVAVSGAAAAAGTPAPAEVEVVGGGGGRYLSRGVGPGLPPDRVLALKARHDAAIAAAAAADNMATPASPLPISTSAAAVASARPSLEHYPPEFQALVWLRRKLENARLLLDRVVKREKLKRSLVAATQRAFHAERHVEGDPLVPPKLLAPPSEGEGEGEQRGDGAMDVDVDVDSAAVAAAAAPVFSESESGGATSDAVATAASPLASSTSQSAAAAFSVLPPLSGAARVAASASSSAPSSIYSARVIALLHELADDGDAAAVSALRSMEDDEGLTAGSGGNSSGGATGGSGVAPGNFTLKLRFRISSIPGIIGVISCLRSHRSGSGGGGCERGSIDRPGVDAGDDGDGGTSSGGGDSSESEEEEGEVKDGNVDSSEEGEEGTDHGDGSFNLNAPGPARALKLTKTQKLPRGGTAAASTAVSTAATTTSADDWSCDDDIARDPDASLLFHILRENAQLAFSTAASAAAAAAAHTVALSKSSSKKERRAAAAAAAENDASTDFQSVLVRGAQEEDDWFIDALREKLLYPDDEALQEMGLIDSVPSLPPQSISALDTPVPPPVIAATAAAAPSSASSIAASPSPSSLFAHAVPPFALSSVSRTLLDVRLSAVFDFLIEFDAKQKRTGEADPANIVKAGFFEVVRRRLQQQARAESSTSSSSSSSAPAASTSAAAVVDDDDDEEEEGEGGARAGRPSSSTQRTREPRVASASMIYIPGPGVDMGYSESVPHLLDFNEVRRRIQRRLYATVDAFAGDVRTVIGNAMGAFPTGSIPHADAGVVKWCLFRALDLSATLGAIADEYEPGPAPTLMSSSSGSGSAGSICPLATTLIAPLLSNEHTHGLRSSPLMNQIGSHLHKRAKPVAMPLDRLPAAGAARARGDQHASSAAAPASLKRKRGIDGAGPAAAGDAGAPAAAAGLASHSSYEVTVGHCVCALCTEGYTVYELGADVALPMPLPDNQQPPIPPSSSSTGPPAPTETWRHYPWYCPGCLHRPSTSLLFVRRPVFVFMHERMQWVQGRVAAWEPVTGRHLVLLLQQSGAVDVDAAAEWAYLDLAGTYFHITDMLPDVLPGGLEMKEYEASGAGVVGLQ